MFSITLTPELLQIKSMQNQCKINVKSMQKKNINKVEYGFLLTAGSWSWVLICNCPSLLITSPAVTWLGHLYWTGKFWLNFTPPPSSEQYTHASTNILSIKSFVMYNYCLSIKCTEFVISCTAVRQLTFCFDDISS